MIVHVAEPYSSDALALLKANRKISLTDSPTTCEALLIRSQTPVNKVFLDQAPQLRLVVTATSGFDHIDWQACQERGITVSYTPEANAGSTAELTLFLMSALLRGTLEQIKNCREGRWRTGLSRGQSLEGQTLGIVGLGRVGSRVADLAHAYRMKIVAHDPYVNPEAFTQAKAERLALVELLRMSDVVTLHVPLTRETRHLINHATLEEMSPECVLINASRGAVVDESEVLVALREQRLRAVALDVLEREPPVASNELLRHPKAILTPHVGAFTTSAFIKASMAAVERVLQFQAGQPLADTLPIPAAWFGKSVAR